METLSFNDIFNENVHLAANRVITFNPLLIAKDCNNLSITVFDLMLGLKGLATKIETDEPFKMKPNGTLTISHAECKRLVMPAEENKQLKMFNKMSGTGTQTIYQVRNPKDEDTTIFPVYSGVTGRERKMQFFIGIKEYADNPTRPIFNISIRVHPLFLKLAEEFLVKVALFGKYCTKLFKDTFSSSVFLDFINLVKESNTIRGSFQTDETGYIEVNDLFKEHRKPKFSDWLFMENPDDATRTFIIIHRSGLVAQMYNQNLLPGQGTCFYLKEILNLPGSLLDLISVDKFIETDILALSLAQENLSPTFDLSMDSVIKEQNDREVADLGSDEVRPSTDRSAILQLIGRLHNELQLFPENFDNLTDDIDNLLGLTENIHDELRDIQRRCEYVGELNENRMYRLTGKSKQTYERTRRDDRNSRQRR